jgi:TonB family protein
MLLSPTSDFPGNQEFYPDSARREGLEGRVIVGCDIGSDGHTRKVSLIWSERGQRSVLAASAVRMVSTMRFKGPGRLGKLRCIAQVAHRRRVPPGSKPTGA